MSWGFTDKTSLPLRYIRGMEDLKCALCGRTAPAPKFTEKHHKDYDSESAERCHNLCQWIVTHKRNPLKESKNQEEHSLGCYLSNRKRASKKGNNLSTEKEIASSYGLTDLFSEINVEVLSNEKCHRVCQWFLEKGKRPYSRAKGEEGLLGRWLGTRIRAKINPSGKASFYESDQAIADSYGLNGLFNRLNKEAISNQTCVEVCEYKKIHGKNPPQTTKLGRWLSTRRKIKRGKCRGVFYDSDQKIAETYGFSDLFVPGRDDRK